MRDVVYFYVDNPPALIPKKDRGEFRYSLRSIERNMPHANVWIVGDKPDWAQNVNHIPVERKGCSCNMSKFFDISNKFVTMGERYKEWGMPSEIIHMDDDMFVMKPVPNPEEDLKGWFIRSMEAQINRRPDVYGQFLWITKRFLEIRGYKDPVHMAAHMPCKMDLDKLPIDWYDGQHALEWKTLHLNYNDRISRHMYGHEIKLGTSADLNLWKKGTPAQFLSTENTTFVISGVDELLKTTFPSMSKYERWE